MPGPRWPASEHDLAVRAILPNAAHFSQNLEYCIICGADLPVCAVLQDPLFATTQRNEPDPSTKRPAWTPAAGLESCRTINANVPGVGKVRGIAAILHAAGFQSAAGALTIGATVGTVETRAA